MGLFGRLRNGEGNKAAQDSGAVATPESPDAVFLSKAQDLCSSRTDPAQFLRAVGLISSGERISGDPQLTAKMSPCIVMVQDRQWAAHPIAAILGKDLLVLLSNRGNLKLARWDIQGYSERALVGAGTYYVLLDHREHGRVQVGFYSPGEAEALIAWAAPRVS